MSSNDKPQPGDYNKRATPRSIFPKPSRSPFPTPVANFLEDLIESTLSQAGGELDSFDLARVLLEEELVVDVLKLGKESHRFEHEFLLAEIKRVTSSPSTPLRASIILDRIGSESPSRGPDKPALVPAATEPISLQLHTASPNGTPPLFFPPPPPSQILEPSASLPPTATLRNESPVARRLGRRWLTHAFPMAKKVGTRAKQSRVVQSSAPSSAWSLGSVPTDRVILFRGSKKASNVLNLGTNRPGKAPIGILITWSEPIPLLKLLLIAKLVSAEAVSYHVVFRSCFFFTYLVGRVYEKEMGITKSQLIDHGEQGRVRIKSTVFNLKMMRTGHCTNPLIMNAGTKMEELADKIVRQLPNELEQWRNEFESEFNARLAPTRALQERAIKAELEIEVLRQRVERAQQMGYTI